MGCAASKPETTASTAQGSTAAAAPTNTDAAASRIPGAFFVTGAAYAPANGAYVRDGVYQGAPLYKNDQLWLLRYTINSGSIFWYIADKDQLNSNDGDYYRVKSAANLPPLAGWGVAKDGAAPAPTLAAYADAASCPTAPAAAPPRSANCAPKLDDSGQEMAHNFEEEEIPGAYYASGAAIPQANGVYVRDGTYSGAPLFKNGQLWLLRYTIKRTGSRWWYIADKDQLDRDDGDLYRVKSPSGLPPQSGWTLAKDGVAPAPTLQALADEGPAGFFVHNAGVAAANGPYARDGSYASCPLYKQPDNGTYWLLRYRMPKGSTYWYIADKDQLSNDNGDLYRVKSDADTPPLSGWRLAKDGVEPLPAITPYYPQPPALAPIAASPEPMGATSLGEVGVVCEQTVVPMGMPAQVPMAVPVTAMPMQPMPIATTISTTTVVVMGVPVVTSLPPIGIPAGGWASHAPVVTAVEVAGARQSEAVPSTLVEKVELLRQELGLSGTVKQVVDEAAAQLGIDAKGRPLAEVAALCAQEFGVVRS